MADKKKIGNDEILRYIWNAINYPELLGIDGESAFDDGPYSDARNASTYREFTNHVNRKMKENPNYLKSASASMMYDTETEIPDNAWNGEVAKDVDLNIENMGIDDVNSLMQSLALQLGFTDSGDKGGALKGLLAATANNEGRDNFKDLIFERLDDPEKRREFLASLDYSPRAGNKDVYERLARMWERSQKADKAGKDKGIINLLRTMAMPQSSKKESEGLDPNRNDVLTDVGTLGGLVATGGNPFAAIGIGLGGDILHDAIDEAGKRKEYEYGRNERSEQGDIRDGISLGAEHATDIGMLLPLIVGRTPAGKAAVKRLSPVVDKVGDAVKSGADKVLSMFGKGKKASRGEAIKIGKQKSKVEKARKEAYEAEEAAKRFSSDKTFENEAEKGASIEESAAKRIFAEDKARALDEERRKLEEMMAKNPNKVLEMLARGGRATKSAVKGRMFDPNFYAIDMLSSGLSSIFAPKQEP